MGLVQSRAQKIVDKLQINVEKAIMHDVPDVWEPLVGRVDGTVNVTNNKVLASGASIASTKVYLEMPKAGIFGYFDLPALRIGLGPHVHDFSSALTITNKTMYAMWALAVSANTVDLNIHAKPIVSVMDVDPVSYTVNADKHIQCKTPELGGFVADVAAEEHYGKPPCLSDELELWDDLGHTVICAAGCSGSQTNCPTDVSSGLAPRFGVACNDSTPEFPEGLCLFHCFGDSDCGGEAVCQLDKPTNRPLGFCTYTTNATRTTTTTTTHNMDDVSITCSFVGNAPHVEPEVVV